jgi:hypothetical protein
MAIDSLEQRRMETMFHLTVQNSRVSRLALGGLGILLTLVLPSAALAQAPSEAPEVKAATAQEHAVAANAAAPSALLPAQVSQIEQATQEARIASRKVELLEEQLAAKAKEPSAASAGEKGFGLRSADGAYALKFHTLLQVDSRWFLQNGALSDKADTFLIRRFGRAWTGPCSTLSISGSRLTLLGARLRCTTPLRTSAPSLGCTWSRASSNRRLASNDFSRTRISPSSKGRSIRT